MGTVESCSFTFTLVGRSVLSQCYHLFVPYNNYSPKLSLTPDISNFHYWVSFPELLLSVVLLLEAVCCCFLQSSSSAIPWAECLPLAENMDYIFQGHVFLCK